MFRARTYNIYLTVTVQILNVGICMTDIVYEIKLLHLLSNRLVMKPRINIVR
jgi:hypothetical protein